MKHDIPRLRRNFCRAQRRGGKIVYVTLEDLAELLTVYTEREIERALQGRPEPDLEQAEIVGRRPGKIVTFRARETERTSNVRNHQPD